MTNEINSLIKKLEDAEILKNSESTQKQLREFVVNRIFPLKDRFDTWCKFCNKQEKSWVIHKGQYGIIGNMVDSCLPYEYDRYKKYTWKDFLRFVKDYNEHKNEDWCNHPKEFKIPSVDDFREILIDTNFGSFVMDW